VIRHRWVVRRIPESDGFVWKWIAVHPSGFTVEVFKSWPDAMGHVNLMIMHAEPTA